MEAECSSELDLVDGDTWKKKSILRVARFQERGQDCGRFVPSGRSAPRFI